MWQRYASQPWLSSLDEINSWISCFFLLLFFTATGVNGQPGGGGEANELREYYHTLKHKPLIPV
ncbi:MAG: hypothetical protein ACKO7C_08095 [Bacteroidota bacterium]